MNQEKTRQTDVICLGNTTQKLVAYHVVTTEDDPVAQRQELQGTKKNYQERTEKVVTIRRHALKQHEKALKAISTGPKKYQGVKWHHELIDMQYEFVPTTP